MSFQATLAKLKMSYIEALGPKVEEISQLLHDGEFEELQNEFHKLKGNGKTYGLAEVSEVAALAEEACLQSWEDLQIWLQLSIELLEDIALLRSQGVQIDLTRDSRFLQLQQRRPNAA